MLFIFRVQNSHPHHITITTTTNITSVELIEEQRTIHLSLTNGWILLTEGKRSRSESLTVANHVLHLPYQNNIRLDFSFIASFPPAPGCNQVYFKQFSYILVIQVCVIPM